MTISCAGMGRFFDREKPGIDGFDGRGLVSTEPRDIKKRYLSKEPRGSRKKGGRSPGKSEEREPSKPELLDTSEMVANLNSKQKKTLEAIFEIPKRGDIPWRDIEGLFEALGGKVVNRSGSRRGVSLGDRVAIFHEPHPERVTDKGALVSVRRFLQSVGVEA